MVMTLADINEGLREEEQALDAFEAQVASHAGVRNAADGRLVAATAVALEEGWWSQEGVHTPIQWLMWRAGLSRTTARRVTLVAARASELPTTVGLLAEGRLSLDQAYTVARYTPAAYERSVCSLAVRLTVTQIQAATRKYAFDLEAKPARERDKPREMSFGNDDDGSWWARIHLAADEGKAVEEALQATRERLHRQARKAAKKAAEAEGRSTKGTADGPLHWEDGGETLSPNLVCLCAHHHRLHHQGLLGIDGNADIVDGLVFRNRHGLVLDQAGQIKVPQPRGMPDVEPYTSPTGERLQTKWVRFQRKPDAPDDGAAGSREERSPAA